MEAGDRLVVLEGFSKSLPRKGNKEAKSPLGYPNTHTGLPTLITDFVVLQVEGGHRFVVLESFSKSLSRKGNKEAKAHAPSPKDEAAFKTLALIMPAKRMVSIVLSYVSFVANFYRTRTTRKFGTHPK